MKLAEPTQFNRKSGVAKWSAVLSTSNQSGRKQPTLSFVIPTEPRISYYAAPSTTTYAAFIEESRMKFADPTKLDRKSGGSGGICSTHLRRNKGARDLFLPTACHAESQDRFRDPIRGMPHHVALGGEVGGDTADAQGFNGVDVGHDG